MEKTSTPNLKNTATLFNKKTIALGCFSLFLAVLFGAFGAHGLEGKVSEKALNTYKTGNLYHYYHSFALLFLGLIGLQLGKTFSLVKKLFVVGIVLFSFCCYAYTFSGVKMFAMIVPLGGMSFVVAWLILGVQVLRSSKS